MGLNMLLLCSCEQETPVGYNEEDDLIRTSNHKAPEEYVIPFIGTEGHGHTFPGATTPFGMIQLSPDTRIDSSWNGYSGYHYSDSLIYGFTHTHISAADVSGYGDILLMPVRFKTFDSKSYAALFSHDKETALAGYYGVTLANDIRVELTTTPRVGIHQYYFPDSNAQVILDLQNSDELLNGKITVIDSITLGVTRIRKAWNQEQHVYGQLKFSHPFTITYNSDKTIAHLAFSKCRELLIKVGYSFVDETGAGLNLSKEASSWDFQTYLKAAKLAWHTALSKIKISDPSENKKSIFYSALYHTMIHPNIAMDIDHRYRGIDNKIHIAEDFDYYTTFSLWNAYKAAHPIYTLIDKKRTRDFLKTFLVQYEQGGQLPVWELASNETNYMIGYHNVSVITDALVKGIGGFNDSLAFGAMEKNANWNHSGLPIDIASGHISIEDERESVSKTVENAYNDWCIAQLAQMRGEKIAYQTYMERSQRWKNLLDLETGLMRPRKNGAWITPFNPNEINNPYFEANAWQYSFFVPHDIYGLISTVGGHQIFEKKLDLLFSEISSKTSRHNTDITGFIGQYVHGNKSSHHIAYLYNYINKSQKTQEKINTILTSFYTTKPIGFAGNGSCGQMSAWYVLSALGIYQVNLGAKDFIFGTPHLSEANIQLENGKIFTIKTNSIIPNSPYIIQSSLNDKPYNKAYINYDDIMNGGNLEFRLSIQPASEPYKTENLPPKQPTTKAIVKIPTIYASKRHFVDTLNITLKSRNKETVVYTLDGTEPTKSSNIYKDPFSINASTEVKTKAMSKDGRLSKTVKGYFYKKPNQWSVDINATYLPQYNAGGDEALIDGIYGNEHSHKGDWHGYQGHDFEAIINLGKPQIISKVYAHFLQDTHLRILMPKTIEVSTSLDGKTFTNVFKTSPQIAPKDYTIQIWDSSGNIKTHKAQYIKFKALNYGKLPLWHSSHGEDAIIFVDEIGVQ